MANHPDLLRHTLKYSWGWEAQGMYDVCGWVESNRVLGMVHRQGMTVSPQGPHLQFGIVVGWVGTTFYSIQPLQSELSCFLPCVMPWTTYLWTITSPLLVARCIFLVGTAPELPCSGSISLRLSFPLGYIRCSMNPKNLLHFPFLLPLLFYQPCSLILALFSLLTWKGTFW